ncbi:MAG TPA: NfeD family protein [Smithellaceae bacterium]|nr:NfeD family protein [Smithellaceae bacterium]
MFTISYSAALIWGAIGIVLLILELATASFILCFIGLGAIIVAVTTGLGLTMGLDSQLIVFAVSSVVLMSLFRKTARRLFAGSHDMPPEYAGQKIKVVRAISAGKEGAVDYRGSEWIAFCDENATINAGETVEIIAIEGIRIKVKPVL